MEKQLEDYLYDHIPITKAMEIKVKEASSQRVILSAPIAPNINHKKTVFGGSLQAAATLACWGLIYVNFNKIGETNSQIVIAKSKVSYLAPIDDNFDVECTMPEATIWQKFVKTVRLKNKGRIHLRATICLKEHLCVDFNGEFAALRG
jgi:thioesterase domain-containing protein